MTADFDRRAKTLRSLVAMAAQRSVPTLSYETRLRCPIFTFCKLDKFLWSLYRLLGPYREHRVMGKEYRIDEGEESIHHSISRIDMLVE